MYNRGITKKLSVMHNGEQRNITIRFIKKIDTSELEDRLEEFEDKGFDIQFIAKSFIDGIDPEERVKLIAHEVIETADPDDKRMRVHGFDDYLIAHDEEGNIVGSYALGDIHESTNELESTHLLVNEDWQKKGIGRVLIDAIAESFPGYTHYASTMKEHVKRMFRDAGYDAYEGHGTSFIKRLPESSEQQ